MSSGRPGSEGDGEERVFVQGPIDYAITGSRRWTDLSGGEQDEYLLTCFMGESPRSQLEGRLNLFDRVASSVANGLLGAFRQYDINTGTAHYQPESPTRAQRVLVMRLATLRGTPLGERLFRAQERQASESVTADDYAGDPVLKFYNIGPRGTAGLEILSEDAIGGYPPVEPYRGGWGDWAALELHQAKEHTAVKQQRWERDMAEPVGAPAVVTPPVVMPKTVRAAHQLPPPTPPAAPLGPMLIASAMLLWALVPANPYGYYVLLRWVCTALFVYLALTARGHASNNWAFALGVGAVVYNPFLPLGLGRPVWNVINIATIILLAAFFIATRGRSEASSRPTVGK